MKNAKLTKAQISIKLIEAEKKIEELESIALYKKREVEKIQEKILQEKSQLTELHQILTHIRNAIQTTQAVCYPESSLYFGESNKDDPPEFLLLKYIYNQANNGS